MPALRMHNGCSCNLLGQEFFVCCPKCSQNLLWGELIRCQNQLNDKQLTDHWSDELQV